MHTVCPGRLRNQQSVCVYLLTGWRNAPFGEQASASIIIYYYHYLRWVSPSSTFHKPLPRGIHRLFFDIDDSELYLKSLSICLPGPVDGLYVCIYPVCFKLQLYDLYTISISNLSMRVLKLKAEYDNYRPVCYTFRVLSTVFLFMPCISFSFRACCWRSPPRAHTIQ